MEDKKEIVRGILPPDYDIEYYQRVAEYNRKEEARRRNLELSKDQSKKRLMQNLEKKFKTTMIGALSRFEKQFGFLWGHGKDPRDLTAKEREFLELWTQTRTEVLDNGNNQLRIASEEVAQYTVAWEKYKAVFTFKDNKENTNEERD